MKIELEDPAKAFYCPIKRQRGKALLNCPACQHYPCSALRVQDTQYLNNNLEHESAWLERRRGKMVIVEKEDGTLEKREKFNVQSPTEKDLKNVARVYVANKCYEKQIKLVPLRQQKEGGKK